MKALMALRTFMVMSSQCSTGGECFLFLFTMSLNNHASKAGETAENVKCFRNAYDRQSCAARGSCARGWSAAPKVAVTANFSKRQKADVECTL